MARPRKHIQPEDVVFLVDTREQTPLNFKTVRGTELFNFKVEKATLVTGDYSVLGLEAEICVERKALADMVQCCYGPNRERFEKELRRMAAFPCRLVVVEASWEEILKGGWRSQIPPAAVKGSLMRWMTWGIPFHFAPSRDDAASFVANYMWLHTKTVYDRLRCFHNNLTLAGDGGVRYSGASKDISPDDRENSDRRGEQRSIRPLIDTIRQEQGRTVQVLNGRGSFTS